jgi:O-antigen ligase
MRFWNNLYQVSSKPPQNRKPKYLRARTFDYVLHCMYFVVVFHWFILFQGLFICSRQAFRINSLYNYSHEQSLSSKAQHNQHISPLHIVSYVQGSWHSSYTFRGKGVIYVIRDLHMGYGFIFRLFSISLWAVRRQISPPLMYDIIFHLFIYMVYYV